MSLVQFTNYLKDASKPLIAWLAIFITDYFAKDSIIIAKEFFLLIGAVIAVGYGIWKWIAERKKFKERMKQMKGK